jgi:hypothetical protein
LRKYILIEIAIVLLVLANSALFAQPVISTTIESEPLAYIVSGHSITLEATITDSKKVLEARCYFRTLPNGATLYVPMHHQTGNRYRCTLPSYASHISGLEYFFLVVNGEAQVIRSTYFQSDNSPSKAIPKWQMDTNSELPLEVYSELNSTGHDSAGIDDEYATRAETSPSEKHGLLVDIYAPEEIPTELNAAPGYFGGFVHDTPGQPPRPVKGFGIGLGAPNSLDLDAPQSRDQLDSFSQPYATMLNISGSNWSGYFMTTGYGNRQSISAVISQSGSRVSIVTSKSGLGHYLIGSINSRGHMLLYDQYDGEDWTTHYGPASAGKVAIYDYICQTCSQLNVISLTRPIPPSAPSNISASKGIYTDKVLVSWSASSGANRYQVYRCATGASSSCIYLSDASGSPYADINLAIGTTYYYRVVACNHVGCSGYSAYDTGFLKMAGITPIYNLLLE